MDLNQGNGNPFDVLILPAGQAPDPILPPGAPGAEPEVAEPEVAEVPAVHLAVNVGRGALIICRDIPLDQAQEAINGFAIWTNQPDGFPGGSLDVTSVTGERSVIPYHQIVMVRGRTEA